MGGLKPGILWVQVAAILAILGAVILEISLDHRRVLDDAQAEADRVRSVIWENSAQTFSTLETVLGELARDVAHAGDVKQISSLDLSYLENLLQVSRRGLPFVGALTIIDENGKVLASSDAAMSRLADLSGSPLFTVHQRQPSSALFIQEPGAARAAIQHSQWLLNVSRAATDDNGKLMGVVIASLSLEAMANAYERLRSHYDDVAGLARTDGRLLVRSPFQIDVEEGTLLDSASLGVGVTSTEQGTYRNNSGVYGVDRLVSFQKVKHFPVVAYAGVSIDQRMQAWVHRALVQSGLGMLAIGLVLAFGHAWRRLLHAREQEGERRLSRMNSLVRASSQLMAARDIAHGVQTLADVTRELIPCLNVSVQVSRHYFGEPFDAVSRAGNAVQVAGKPGPALKAQLNGADAGEIGTLDVSGFPNQRFDADDRVLLQELSQVASIALQKVWAEQLSRADRDQLENVLDSMSDAVFMLDTEWRFTFMNGYARRLLGHADGSLIDKDFWDEFPELQGTDLQSHYMRAVEQQRDIDLEFYYERFDAWFHFRAFPSRQGLTVYFQDITEQRNREDQLRQAQKLEAMGQLTGGVAHDFNNLLTVILGNAELLAETLGDMPKLSGLARATADAAVRGSELTGHLLAFARRQPLNPKAADLGSIIAGMQPMLVRTLGEHVVISLSLQPDPWPVMVDRSLFENVILNLVLNARDAMPDGGQLSIRLVNIALQAIDTTALDDISPGDYVCITVSDSGLGMSREALARVFDPFYTTKDVGKGSGLGLSMVHGFVKQSGGAIRIYSRPGEGTTVQIYLPGTSDPVVSDYEANADTVLEGSGESILVVEDEDLVRDFVCGQLHELGYAVASAANGPQALSLLREGLSCDLLFTDIMMPGGMNGRELAEQASMLRPGLKVVFTSGYSDEVIMRDGSLEPGVQLLKKPYRKAELAAVLRAAFNQGVSV